MRRSTVSTCSTGPIRRSNAARLSVRHLHLQGRQNADGLAGLQCWKAWGWERHSRHDVPCCICHATPNNSRSGESSSNCTRVPAECEAGAGDSPLHDLAADTDSRGGGHTVGLAGSFGQQSHLQCKGSTDGCHAARQHLCRMMQLGCMMHDAQMLPTVAHNLWRMQARSKQIGQNVGAGA